MEGLDALHEVMARCTRCDLARGRSRVVPGAGASRAEVLFVGEAPGAMEDQVGLPFVGRSGQLLDDMLTKAGLHRERVFIANVIRCRPPENRSPRPAELQACAGWLQQQLRLIRPSLIVTLGRHALQHFLPGARVTLLQGEPRKIQVADGVLTLYPLLHPSAILRNPRLRDSYAAHFHRLGGILAERTGAT